MQVSTPFIKHRLKIIGVAVMPPSNYRAHRKLLQ